MQIYKFRNSRHLEILKPVCNNWLIICPMPVRIPGWPSAWKRQTSWLKMLSLPKHHYWWLLPTPSPTSDWQSLAHCPKTQKWAVGSLKSHLSWPNWTGECGATTTWQKTPNCMHTRPVCLAHFYMVARPGQHMPVKKRGLNYMFVGRYRCMHICIKPDVQECMHMYVYVYMYVYMYTYMYESICKYTCVYVSVHSYIYGLCRYACI